jgi:flagellar basal-body rod protein FlgB
MANYLGKEYSVANAAEAIGILRFALNGTVAQQKAIANNIANLNVPGYKAEQVSFQKSLASALSQGGNAAIVSKYEQLAPGVNGNNVALPTETSLLLKNNLENQTIDNALTGQFTLIADAIQA